MAHRGMTKGQRRATALILVEGVLMIRKIWNMTDTDENKHRATDQAEEYLARVDATMQKFDDEL